MRKIVFTLATAMVLASCNAQQKKNETDNQAINSQQKDTAIAPQGTWKVNREVDENGNLIRYDSIYSYSYGNINGKKMNPTEMDSAMASFRNYIKGRMPAGFSPQTMTPFESDSLNTDFFEKGFFENNWEDFFPDMQKQLMQMDSLHQKFFQDSQQGLFPPEERKGNQN